jgi:hypothetical protein
MYMLVLHSTICAGWYIPVTCLESLMLKVALNTGSYMVLLTMPWLSG